MEAKFTPGPWHHDGYERVRPVDGKQDGSNDVCHVYQHNGEGMANMQSIAALPDLYEACQAVKDKLEYLCNLWGAEGVTRSLIQKLDNALAKATGEQVAS